MKKIDKLFIIVACVSMIVSTPTQAQGVYLSIVNGSIKTRNDTLFFRIRLQNKTENNFIFCDLLKTSPDISKWKIKNHFPKYKFTQLYIDIASEQNQDRKFRDNTDGARTLKYTSISDTYYLLNSNQIKEYDIAYDIWPLNINRGKYKIELTYFANNVHIPNFSRLKTNERNLDKYLFFQGKIKSNSHWVYFR